MNHVGTPRVEVPLDGLKLWTLLQSHAVNGESVKMPFEANSYSTGNSVQHDSHQMNNCPVQHHLNAPGLGHSASSCRCPLCPVGQNHGKDQLGVATATQHHQQQANQYHHNSANLAKEPSASSSNTAVQQMCQMCNKKIRRTKKQIEQQTKNGTRNFSQVCDKCLRSGRRNSVASSSSQQVNSVNYHDHRQTRVPQVDHEEYSSQYNSETAAVSAHVCKMCRKGFAFKHDLDRHSKASKGECGKQFRCPKCGKYFSNGGNLKRHSMIHTGEKPYECHLCTKSFRSKTLLSNHIRTHTGERPYLCRYCEKRFSKSENLKRHEKIHLKNGTTYGGIATLHSR